MSRHFEYAHRSRLTKRQSCLWPYGGYGPPELVLVNDVVNLEPPRILTCRPTGVFSPLLSNQGPSPPRWVHNIFDLMLHSLSVLSTKRLKKCHISFFFSIAVSTLRHPPSKRLHTMLHRPYQYLPHSYLLHTNSSVINPDYYPFLDCLSMTNAALRLAGLASSKLVFLSYYSAMALIFQRKSLTTTPESIRNHHYSTASLKHAHDLRW